MRPSSTHPWNRDPTPGIAALVTGVALAGFIVLTAALLFFPAFQDVDARISEAMRGVGGPVLEALARGLSFLGSGWVMAALTVAGSVWLLVLGRRAETVLLAATMALGTLTGNALKALVERARPGLEVARIPVPESYSFPSGHALAALLFFGIAAFLFFVLARSVRVKIWALLACWALAFGVAISRVYLGVHYLGDIIASWMLGCALILVAIGLYVSWITRERAA
ncbi:MAG: phosphatase PAP2 family protein [Anaerosomatales bacterium]|nr:phosphatase PAP2 family protein [Anaerosomatales bacterium]MDT8434389.1 phosphatase PAP2 family protein [Anaerosomatales bacterium]